MGVTIDIYDYPSDEHLESIREWSGSWRELMTLVRELWWKANLRGWCTAHIVNEMDDVLKYEISTGGWSGNESLVEALQENTMFWLSCWQQSRRGGHYIFEART